jgi:hypothetical protein
MFLLFLLLLSVHARFSCIQLFHRGLVSTRCVHTLFLFSTWNHSPLFQAQGIQLTIASAFYRIDHVNETGYQAEVDARLHPSFRSRLSMHFGYRHHENENLARVRSAD